MSDSSPCREGSFSPVSLPGHGGDLSRIPLLFPAPTRESGSIPHIAIEMSESDKQIGKKTKRKDTTSSISYFIHKITQGRSSSDVKGEFKDDVIADKGDALMEEEKKDLIERPQLLDVPMLEQWFEPQTYFEEADTAGEWRGFSPDTVDENPTSTSTYTGREGVVRSLELLLEDFRMGRIHSMSIEEIKSMEVTRRSHENISDRHLRIADEESSGELSDREISLAFDAIYADLDCVHDKLKWQPT